MASEGKGGRAFSIRGFEIKWRGSSIIHTYTAYYTKCHYYQGVGWNGSVHVRRKTDLECK